MKPNIILCLTLVIGGLLLGCSTGVIVKQAGFRLGNGPSLLRQSSFNGKQFFFHDILWDVQTGKKLKEFPGLVYAATFGPDGVQILTSSSETPFGKEQLVVWNIATGREIRRLNMAFEEFQLSPDVTRLLSASTAGTNNIQIWDAISGRRLLTFRGFSTPFAGGPSDHYVSFSADGRRIVALDWRKITVWDAITGSQVCAIQQEGIGDSRKPDFFVSTQFSPDGKLVLTEQCNRITKLWDAATGREVQSFVLANQSTIAPDALFTPSGAEVISGEDGGIAVLWDAQSGKEIRRFQIPGTQWGVVDRMIISRDGKRLITVCKTNARGRTDEGAALWDVESGRLIKQFDDPAEQIAAFSPNDETFITTLGNKPGELWDGATGKIIRQFDASATASDTCDPRGLVLSGHTLYGITSGGYNGESGAVFKVNTDGRGFKILHGFTAWRSLARTNSDGWAPQGVVLLGDTLYGTAQEGGSAGCGTVFKVKTNGKGFTVLHSFSRTDGATPWAGLVMSAQALYGMTQRGGSADEGTVFKVNLDGSGFAILHSFSAAGGINYTNSDGHAPQSELVLSDKVLYGASCSGGVGGTGTVFKVNTDGTSFSILHQFAAGTVINDPRRFTNSDGADEKSTLVLSGNTLYGTASGGGVTGEGTIFKVGTNGTDFAVLHNFPPVGFLTNSDGGLEPGQGLACSGDTLYGSTSAGSVNGRGTIFKIGADGAGFATLPLFTNRAELGWVNGLVPSGGALYGTMEFGGPDGGGFIFKANTNGKTTKAPKTSPIHQVVQSVAVAAG